MQLMLYYHTCSSHWDVSANVHDMSKTRILFLSLFRWSSHDQTRVTFGLVSSHLYSHGCSCIQLLSLSIASSLVANHSYHHRLRTVRSMDSWSGLWVKEAGKVHFFKVSRVKEEGKITLHEWEEWEKESVWDEKVVVLFSLQLLWTVFCTKKSWVDDQRVSRVSKRFFEGVLWKRFALFSFSWNEADELDAGLTLFKQKF